MNTLVINCGSSSIKVAVVENTTGRRLMSAQIEGIGEPNAELRVGEHATKLPTCPDHKAALRHLTDLVESSAPNFVAIGHRVVHGGEEFVQPTRIDDDVCNALNEITSLAPLHNPACLAGIHAFRHLFPLLPQVAVFDTAFHANLPIHARMYALPARINRIPGMRRFGFHGISHESVARQVKQFLGPGLPQMRLISCHLGNGCSITAIENGRSLETSMGMTPLEGLVMGTRAGDLDPGIVIRLLRELELSVDDLEHMLNHESGLMGLAGSKDMRVIEKLATRGDEAASVAIDLFAHRIRKYVGAYSAVMGGVDAIAFTGGIGQNSSRVRQLVSQRLEYLGAQLDEDRNRQTKVGLDKPVVDISLLHSRTRLLVVATDEERMIAELTAEHLASQHSGPLVVEPGVSVKTGIENV
jgi:acetate kinase